jgi:hypothetical protein
MSSHHFVKEGQEAALIIADAVPYKIIAPILEWAPLVLVFQKALEEVMTWSIKIDVVICQKANLDTVSAAVEEQFPIEIIAIDSWETASTRVLDFLVKEKHHSVVVATDDVDRMMSMLETFGKLKASILVREHLKWSLYEKGLYEKWMPKGDGVYVRGVIQELVNGQYAGNKVVSSADGVMTIKGTGPFWIGEEL